MHPQTKLQNGKTHPLLPETTTGRYRRNNPPIPIIGKMADNWRIPIISASLLGTDQNFSYLL